MPTTKTKTKPAARSAEPTQPEPPQPTTRDLRRAEVKRQFETLEHFAKVICDDISPLRFERLCTFKLIMDRDDGSSTPIEDFITGLVDSYEHHDDDGVGLTLEDIQWHLRQSITDDNNLSRVIENAHFMASRYPLPKKPAEETASN